MWCHVLDNNLSRGMIASRFGAGDSSQKHLARIQTRHASPCPSSAAKIPHATAILQVPPGNFLNLFLLSPIEFIKLYYHKVAKLSSLYPLHAEGPTPHVTRRNVMRGNSMSLLGIIVIVDSVLRRLKARRGERHPGRGGPPHQGDLVRGEPVRLIDQIRKLSLQVEYFRAHQTGWLDCRCVLAPQFSKLSSGKLLLVWKRGSDGGDELLGTKGRDIHQVATDLR